MPFSFRNLFQTFKSLFSSPIENTPQWLIVLVIAGAFMLMPIQSTVNDWELNTSGLWNDSLHVYENADRVYPPWGLILLIPFYLMQIEGARLFSVLTVALLVQRRNWSLFTFILLVFSPYFIFTMYLCNMDILVLVFPILLWEISEGRRLQGLSRGLALSILLLKPQAAILIWVYFLWKNLKNWKSLIVPLLITSIIVVPVSLLGSPPLIFQWLGNISNPSPQNQLYWSINNVSLTDFYPPLMAVSIILFAAGGLYFFFRKIKFSPDQNLILSSFLMISMMLSPYASQQSVSSALVFVPSLQVLVIQYLVTLLVGLVPATLFSHEPIRVLFIFVCGLVLYAVNVTQSKKESIKIKRP